MTITPLKKVTLFGLRRDKTKLLEDLQALGCMHLLALRPPPAEVENIASPHAQAAYKALQFLTVVPERRRQVVRDETFDVGVFVERVSALMQKLREARDRRDFLTHRIAEVEPWGDLVFPPLEKLAGNRFWFYRLPVRHLGALQDSDCTYEIVGRDNRFAYLVLISPDEPPDDILPVSRTHTGSQPLAVLYEELEDIEIELEELRAQRQGLTRYIYLLSANLAEAENRAALAYAEQQTFDDDAMVAVQGWVPEDLVSAVEALANGQELACVVEDPTPEDRPPTLIDQPDTMGAGRDLTMFYQVPDYRSWDPTLILVGSFCVFFAMIMADAGYGMLLLLGLLFYWRKLGASVTLRAYRRLGVILSVCAMVYGVMVGSYFGVEPAGNTLAGHLQILSVSDFDTMMRISIIIGVLHVGFANGMMAYVNRQRRSALSNVGWIGVLAGGLCVWLSGLAGAVALLGYAVAAAGFLTILLFSSDRPVNRPADRLLRVFDGIKGLGRAMNAFGDVLSYMRLFALGLASASLATTFNDLASSAHQALPGLGVLAAALILLFGHSLNLGLGVMSGVVHGLRLNFIEFFNWGLPEEGKAFRKFARKEVEP